MHRSRFLAATALSVLVAACWMEAGTSSSQAHRGEPTGAWLITGGIVDGEALPVIDASRVTAVFEGSTISGTAACNHYGARLVALPDRIRIEVTSTTAMACADPAMDVEARYLGALSRVDTLTVIHDELLMRGRGVDLRSKRLEPPPTARLLDTTWRLESLVSGELASAPMGEPATLEIRSGGTFAGSTGCRAFDGKWIEYGDLIETPEWGLTGACSAELDQQDSHVVSVIEAGFIPIVDGDHLTLTDPGGEALVYQAQD